MSAGRPDSTARLCSPDEAYDWSKETPAPAVGLLERGDQLLVDLARRRVRDQGEARVAAGAGLLARAAAGRQEAARRRAPRRCADFDS